MRIAQQVFERFRIHGFDEMHIETGIRRFAPVLVLSPARDRERRMSLLHSALRMRRHAS